MKNARSMPQWAEDFKSVHGIYPIAGGSGNEPPPPQQTPAPEGGGGGTVTVTPPAEEEEEETPPTQTPAAQQGFQAGAEEDGKVYTAEDLARVRQQEKDKLYGRINEMSETLQQMREREEREAREREEAEAREREEAERKAEEEMDFKTLLAKKEEEWQNRFQTIQQEIAQKDALLEREREFQALENYRQSKLSEHEDDIMPELRDMVQGNTPEEIDASINALVEKTSHILGQVAASQQQYRQQMPGPRVTAPAMGPLEQNESAQQTLSADDIRNMDMKTYREYRDQLMQATSRKAREGGLYG